MVGMAGPPDDPGAVGDSTPAGTDPRLALHALSPDPSRPFPSTQALTCRPSLSCPFIRLSSGKETMLFRFCTCKKQRPRPTRVRIQGVPGGNGKPLECKRQGEEEMKEQRRTGVLCSVPSLGCSSPAWNSSCPAAGLPLFLGEAEWCRER